MSNKTAILFSILIITFLSSSFSYITGQTKPVNSKIIQDTLKKQKTVVFPVATENDSLTSDKNLKLKIYKKSAHASYYSNRFNNRKTASGSRFSNNDYTAAHKKFPFGTKVKITNEANGKSVIVEITDRGPFIRTREIDLSKRAFMDITQNKDAGEMKVTIEIIEEIK